MNDAMASRIALILSLLAAGGAAGGCTPKGPSAPSVTVPAAGNGAKEAVEPPGPAPLAVQTPEEHDLETRLRATVTHLAGEIGERNIGRSWNLASATDDLARALEKMGYEVHRQGIVVGDDVVQNLDVRAGGGARGAEALVVGAHFDSAAGSPGANDDASGAAGVIELARLFHDRKTSRSVRFALFSNGEAPHFGTDHGGSLVYGKQLVQEGVRVVGMVSLDGIGVYLPTPPKEREILLPATSDYVAVLGNEASRPFFEEVHTAMKANASLEVAAAVLAEDARAVRESDCTAFWKLGLPAVSVTDTGALRDPNHHGKADAVSALDFARMARVVAALEKSLEALAGS